MLKKTVISSFGILTLASCGGFESQGFLMASPRN